MNDTIWLSCYIYYKSLDASADKLLVTQIEPFVAQAMQEKHIAGYFFIRYRDAKGSHIRLRFKGDPEILENTIKPLLQKTFSPIRFVSYRPEYSRYGGKKGIEISEKLFQSSSAMVLAFLSQQKTFSSERSLGMALQMNLAMVYALGFDKAEAQSFFSHLAHGDNEAFEKSLSKQQDTVLPFIKQFWSLLNTDRENLPAWMADWSKQVSSIGQELKEAYKDKQLTHLDPKHAHKQNPLWYIYESWVHMNNNRLGIPNADEPFAAYIIARGLETL